MSRRLTYLLLLAAAATTANARPDAAADAAADAAPQDPSDVVYTDYDGDYYSEHSRLFTRVSTTIIAQHNRLIFAADEYGVDDGRGEVPYDDYNYNDSDDRREEEAEEDRRYDPPPYEYPPPVFQ